MEAVSGLRAFKSQIYKVTAMAIAWMFITGRERESDL